MESDEPVWVTASAVIEHNIVVCEDAGEPALLRDAELLEAAVQRPWNYWYYEGERDILALGCRLLFAIAENHPFLDGNKRTAFLSAVEFMLANGQPLAVEDSRELGDRIIAVIERKLDFDSFVASLRDGRTP